jgi:hypothetical protein
MHHEQLLKKNYPCSAELISTAYQPWNNVFLLQQISHSRLISQKSSLPNRTLVLEIYLFWYGRQGEYLLLRDVDN